MTYRPDLLAPDDKAALQRELQAGGYYSGQIDGLWGPKSAAAFSAWQEAQTLRVIVDTDLTPAVRAEFERLFAAAAIVPMHGGEIARVAHRLLAGRDRYEAVSVGTGVPWWIIGLIHGRECDFRFDQHLHNGDPLTARTVQEPKGRPVTGHAPFDWSYSAADALLCDGLTRWKDWSLAGALHKLEAFNGYGYRLRGLPTPYLWSMTNLERSGKFVRDGVFDPNALDGQVGCVAVLKALIGMGAVRI